MPEYFISRNRLVSRGRSKRPSKRPRRTSGGSKRVKYKTLVHPRMYPKGHTHKYASGASIANVSGTQHGPTGEAQMEASIANVSGTQSGPIIETEIKASDVNVSEMKLDQINEAEAEAIKDVWERAFPRSDWETFVGKILHQDTSIFVGRVGEEQRIVSMAVVQTPNGASVADLFQDWLHGPGNAHEKPESDSETWSDNESSGQTRKFNIY